MNWNKIYGLSLRHFFNQKFFSKDFGLNLLAFNSNFLVGIYLKVFYRKLSLLQQHCRSDLTAAILYDFLFRSSISYNMMFLEEIWSRNFTNFIAPIKISEIITALTITAVFRTMIGLVPAAIVSIPLFGVSIFKLGPPLLYLLICLYIFWYTLGLLVTSGLIRFGPSFENIAWASLFLLHLWAAFITQLKFYLIGYR